METEFTFGVDYYPEHWPAERWREDARLMREMGIEIVRMGEFSWHKFEPSLGTFDFAWLDEAIAILAREGIKSIIGTPTAAPPAWLIERNTEILPIDQNGIRKGFGGRHHNCQSNPDYRNHVRRIVGAMSEHFGGHPSVVGWQIDNELGNSHEELCMCDSCQKSFQLWLERKYKTIKELNNAWGTAFWSQDYDNFAQIPVPRTTPTEHSPSLLLDWKRFCSDLVVDYANEQIKIIRKNGPDQFITHNCMGIHPKTDYFELAKNLDFVSNDQYATGYYFEQQQSPEEISAYQDFVRGLKGKNYWMMELQSGATGGRIIGGMPKPGQLKLWALHSIAHGADTVVFFRWRTCPFGTEQYWHGILPHNGIPSGRYKELKDTISQMKEIMEDIRGITTESEAAILYDYDQQWAFQIQPLHPGLSYLSQVLQYYQAFFRTGIPMDFVSKKSDFSPYRLLAAPLSLIMDTGRAGRLEQYVMEGGTLLLTMRSGVKNESNVCFSEGELPGFLTRLAGIVVEDYDCLVYGEEPSVIWKENMQITHVRKWMDVVQLKGAQVLAEFADGYGGKRPAVTVHHYGKGMVYYVAAEPMEDLMQTIVNHISRTCSLSRIGFAQQGAELKLRKGRKRDYLFALNHTAQEKRISVDGGFGENEKTADTLQPYESKIYCREQI